MGSWIYNIGLHDEFVDFVLEKDLPLDKLITNRFTIDQARKLLDSSIRGIPGKFCSLMRREILTTPDTNEGKRCNGSKDPNDPEGRFLKGGTPHAAFIRTELR